VRRVAHADRPSPYAKSLERLLLPTKERVVEAARALAAY
jgi:pyruvate/2-oxoglutarate/acetoin dehydrogenase E1 component